MLAREAREHRHEQAAIAASPLVAISILNWNGWQDTLECLESVRRLDYPNFLTVVVDNGSWNGSADKIKSWAEANLGPGHALADYTRETALAGGIPETEQALDGTASTARMVLIRNEENLGFTGGNNVSIHYAIQRPDAADYVFLLNNDAKVKHDCLGELVSTARKTGAGLVGARVKDSASGQIDVSAWGLGIPLLRSFFHPLLGKRAPHWSFIDGCVRCFAVGGTAMLARAVALRDIRRASGRYLDPALFMYGDEFDLGDAMAQTGHKTYLAQNALVLHRPAGSSGGQFNPLAYYYHTRNRIVLARRLLPLRYRGLFHPWNLLTCAIRAAKNLANRRKHSARAIACGFLDGYRGVAGRWKDHDKSVRCAQMPRRPTQAAFERKSQAS